MRSTPNLEIFKEPRGFIKIVEIGIAIFAFSTTAGYYSEFRVLSSIKANSSANCSDHKTHKGERVFNILAKFEYPFDNEIVYVGNNSGTEPCITKFNLTHQGKIYEDVKGKYKDEAQFFVFTGVATFLYCLVACVYYLFMDTPEENMSATDVGKCSFVVIDFVISIILAIFWFAGSAAWASGVSGLKDNTDPASYINKSPLCHQEPLTCKVEKDPNYATLKVSIILGFLNLFVWLGNLWFLFKETPWHNPRQERLPESAVQ